MGSQDTVLMELEQEIEKESNFKEILEEYQTLSGVSDGPFLTVPVLDVYKTPKENLLLKFEIIDGLTGFINVSMHNHQTSSHSKVLFSAISESEPTEWSLELELNKDFHSGIVLADGDEIEVEITWEEQLDEDNYSKVSEQQINKYLEKAVCSTYFQNNKNEYGFVQSEIDAVKSNGDGDNIEIEINWLGQDITWSVPALTNKGGKDTTEFISSYEGLGSLETSRVYITTKDKLPELSGMVYFEDTSSEWVMISKGTYQKYISNQDESTENSQFFDVDNIDYDYITVILMNLLVTIVILGIIFAFIMDLVSAL